jgi:hypothetical protein
MKATQLFGRILRSTHDYVGWFQDKKNENLIISGKYRRLLPIFFIKRVHSFTSLPMDKSWFERPLEPKEEYYTDSDDPNTIEFGLALFKMAYKKWQNWTPLLEGDWDVSGDTIYYGHDLALFLIRKDSTLNDFIAYCAKQEIELVINPEFEI